MSNSTSKLIIVWLAVGFGISIIALISYGFYSDQILLQESSQSKFILASPIIGSLFLVGSGTILTRKVSIKNISTSVN